MEGPALDRPVGQKAPKSCFWARFFHDRTPFRISNAVEIERGAGEETQTKGGRPCRPVGARPFFAGAACPTALLRRHRRLPGVVSIARSRAKACQDYAPVETRTRAAMGGGVGSSGRAPSGSTWRPVSSSGRPFQGRSRCRASPTRIPDPAGFDSHARSSRALSRCVSRSHPSSSRGDEVDLCRNRHSGLSRGCAHRLGRSAAIKG